MIRSVQPRDAAAIAHLYNHYITDTIVTFEEESVSATDMSARIKDTCAAGLPWLVSEEAGVVLGYAYASKWKSRCSYRHSVESTIYLDRSATGRGLGTTLYRALLDEIGKQGLHAVIGGIALPNPASVALHEKLGFAQVAHFREVGWKFNQWIDVGYWELILTQN